MKPSIVLAIALILLPLAAYAESRVHSSSGRHNGFFGPERDFSQRFTYRNNIPPIESVRRQQQFFQSPARSYNRASRSGARIYDQGDTIPFGLLSLDSEGGETNVSATVPGAFGIGPNQKLEKWPHQETRWPSEELSKWFSSYR